MNKKVGEIIFLNRYVMILKHYYVYHYYYFKEDYDIDKAVYVGESDKNYAEKFRNYDAKNKARENNNIFDYMNSNEKFLMSLNSIKTDSRKETLAFLSSLSILEDDTATSL